MAAVRPTRSRSPTRGTRARPGVRWGPRDSVTRPDLQNKYDTAAALRDDTADVRDTAATHRDTIADKRDQVAERRDTLADERDRLAERTLAQIGELVTAAHLQRTLATRAAAEDDRHHASADRAAWAINRTHAEDDRNDAERDRTASSDDRGSSAGDRQVDSLDSLTGALQRRTHRRRPDESRERLGRPQRRRPAPAIRRRNPASGLPPL